MFIMAIRPIFNRTLITYLAIPISGLASETTGKIEPKIVGGYDTTIEQVSYQVSIRLTANERKSYGSGHLCGGVVISQRLVATAAHCCYITDKKKYRTAGEFVLVMGSTYLTSSTDRTLMYYLQQLITHENYSPEALTNDIALMFINGYIPWNWPTVTALALNSQLVATNTDCLISGWGLLQQSGTFSSNTLQAATVPIVSYATCRISYNSIPVSQVCAGYWTGGVDACQGDSGGPMSCNGMLAGIVSYGAGCAAPGYPGVYTNVSFYYDWIVQKNNSLNYTIYHNGGVRQGSNWSYLGILPLIVAFLLEL
ncbi:trypsin eta isoform X1 [Drosophila mauritiana]|uniref:Trypsin eta isoform X1 n=1 Tax=Drosophila mauritiana TaxID=7226 RepID=A0A6P8KIV1_DROMA|nr:trypsin eta isoform X1 [Drosophila mauritiana]